MAVKHILPIFISILTLLIGVSVMSGKTRAAQF